MGKFSGKEKLLLTSFASAWILYAIFISLYGSEATVMMGFFGTNTVEQGFLTTIQCIGGLGVSFFCVFFGEKLNKMTMIGFGIILLCAGSLATVFGTNYMQIVLFALVAGIGYTFMDIMENASVVDIFGSRTKTALPTLHMTFGIGAMVGPYFATAVVDPNLLSSFSWPFLIVGIATAGIFILFVFASRRMKGEKRPQKAAAVAVHNPGSIFKYPAAWVMLAAGILYFSFQRGLMTWYPSYLIDSANVSFTDSGWALTLFFMGSLGCRIVSPFLFNRFSILKMTIFMTVLCGVFMIASVAVAPASLLLAEVFGVAGGVMQGAFVAAYVFLFCEMFPGKSASATSVVMIAINIGGITAPLWMGSMAESIGFALPLYILFIMLFVCAALIAIGYRVNRKRVRAAEEMQVCPEQ